MSTKPNTREEREYERGLEFLEEEELEELEAMKPGLWCSYDDGEIYGIDKTKSDTIVTLQIVCGQDLEHCKVKRIRSGLYAVRIPKIDTDPSEHVYRNFTVVSSLILL